MFLTFDKKRWRLRFVNTGPPGEIDPPDRRRKEIRIRKSLRDEKLLETLVHEFLHACLWSIDEEFIETSANDIARALIKLGYHTEEKGDQ